MADGWIKIPTLSSIKQGYQNVKTNIDNTVADALSGTPVAKYFQQQELDRIQKQRQQEYAGNVQTAKAKLQAVSSGLPITEEERMRLVNIVNPQIAQINQSPVARAEYERQKQINEILRNEGGGGQPPIDVPGQTLEQPIPGVDEFTFDWDTEVRKAYDSLQNFYAKLLDFAQGDLTLAKRALEYTYQQGMRETAAEFGERMGEVAREKAIEIPKLITDLNRKGMYFSGSGGKKRDIQREGYQAREDALARIKSDTESRLTKEREFNIAGEESGFAKRKFDLERERQKESMDMAQIERQVKSDKFNAQLQKQAQEENRNVQNVQSKYTGSLLGDAGGATTGKWQGKDSQGREYGGWYWRPELNRAQRYFGGDDWRDQ